MKLSHLPVVLGLVVVGSAPSLARDCRMPEAPPGVRVPPAPGCETARPPLAKSQEPRAARAGSTPGFIDLGNGSQLKVGGQVRVDVRGRR
jgi:hypothetical protein